MTTMHDRIQLWRRAVRTFLVLAALTIPFLRIRGESALRFDVPTLTLHFFGAAVWMDQFFLVLLAILILSFLAVFLTILLGRIWCGWLCPQTVVVELTAYIDQVRRKGMLFRSLAIAALLLVSLILAADIIWFFVDPRVFIADLFSGSLGRVERWAWLSMTAVTFLNFLLLRRTFCATVCPYAKMQGAIFDDRTLVIAPDRNRMDLCMHCDACVAVCPVGIDVRGGLQAECVSCAKCIEVCSARMQQRGERALIGYRFGTAGSAGELFRRPLVLTGAVTASFIALFIAVLLAGAPVDMDIGADPAHPPVRDSNGDTVNTYLLSLTNRTNMHRELTITAIGTEGPVSADPQNIRLGKREHRLVVLALRAEGPLRLRSSPEQVTIVAVSPALPALQIERRAVMLQPW